MTQYVGNFNSSYYPYSAIVYIEAIFTETGKTYTGSGVVVGKNDVLTASHVIFNAAEGGIADLIKVYPGKDGWSEPFGSYTYDLVNYFEIDHSDGFINQEESQYDLALLGFSEDVGTLTGWFGIDPDAGSGLYHLTGYPSIYSDHTGRRMVDDYGYAFVNPYYSVFDYGSTIESSSGGSGGPLWYMGETGPYVVGINSTSGWAADISLNYSTIIDWIEGNDYLMDVAAPDDYADNSSTTGIVAVNGTATGMIETETDEDWFAVTLEAGTTYLIDLKGEATPDGTLADFYLLGIYSSNKEDFNLISGTSHKSGGMDLNSRVEFTPESGGTYYMAIGTQNNGTGPYTLAVTVAVTPEMILDWAEYTFPELFPERMGEHLQAIEYDGVIYTARAYSEAWGSRYLGITPDREIFGLGDFTGHTLQQFETVGYWSDQVLADLSGRDLSFLNSSVKNDPSENLYDSSVNAYSDQNLMETEPLGGAPIIDQWFGF